MTGGEKMGPGSLGRTDVYMYTLKQHKRLPDMKHPRYNHACSYYYDGQKLVSITYYVVLLQLCQLFAFLMNFKGVLQRIFYAPL